MDGCLSRLLSNRALYEEDSSFMSLKSKPGQNMTASVRVPTSDHVAEIVGKQGSKIKELRARTGTYIKTPVKGESPIFIITGRKEGIEMAKKEILAISEYFNKVRNGRLGNNGSIKSNDEVHIDVSVPYDVVGLLVGPKGSTIKKIQQETQTYIVTPNRDRKPVFQISGSVENVEKAKNAIKSYVWQRTGKNLPDLDWSGIYKQVNIGLVEAGHKDGKLHLDEEKHGTLMGVSLLNNMLNLKADNINSNYDHDHTFINQTVLSPGLVNVNNYHNSPGSIFHASKRNFFEFNFDKNEQESVESLFSPNSSNGFSPGITSSINRCHKCFSDANLISYPCQHIFECASCFGDIWKSNSPPIVCTQCFQQD